MPKLAPRLHVLAVRVQDSGGHWSIAKSLPFYRLATLADGAIPEIVKLSYQWFQNGSPISGVFEIFPAANAKLVNFDELASLQGLQEGQNYQLTVIAYDNLGHLTSRRLPASWSRRPTAMATASPINGPRNMATASMTTSPRSMPMAKA